MTRPTLLTTHFPLVTKPTVFCVAFLLLAAAGVRSAGGQTLDQTLATARGGDVQAQLQLGQRYRDGDGVSADPKEAVRWFRQAAEQGDPDAQYALGMLHARGDGMFQDDSWAITWLRRAARQGHPQARAELDEKYRQAGMPRQGSEIAATSAVVAPASDSAVRRGGDTHAVDLHELQAMEHAREHGIAVVFDEPADLSTQATPEKKPGWLSRLFGRARGAETTAQSTLDDNASTVPTLEGPTPVESTPDVGEVITQTGPTRPPVRVTRALASSDAEELAAVERSLQRGDAADVLGRLIALAELGNADAQARLGALYQNGDLVAQDHAQAADWYAKAAAGGNPDAQFNLANMYLVGKGVGVDERKARNWFVQAAASGHVGARENLASLRTHSSVAESPAGDRTQRSSVHPPPFAAYREGDFAGALHGMRELAEAGDPNAQFRIGQMYDRGQGVEADDSWAITWYRRAAGQGHSQAQARLTQLYAEAGLAPSRGPVPVSRSRRDESQPSAAPKIAPSLPPVVEGSRRVLPSQSATDVGRGATGDSSRSEPVRNRNRLATQSPAEAPTNKLDVVSDVAVTQSELPIERGGFQNPSAVVTAAADPDPALTSTSVETEGSQPSEIKARWQRMKGWFTRDKTPAQLPAATAVASNSTELASPVAAIPADVAAGRAALAAGDAKRGADILLRAAESGEPVAQSEIGYLYFTGEGVPRNPTKAVSWYRKAAAQNNPSGQYNLAVAYAFGEGVEQDHAQAASWYRKAAEQGHVAAQHSLGISYSLGEGVSQDDAEAIGWYHRAAVQGYAPAQYNLGLMYRGGKGVEPNSAEAIRWYQRAAAQGHAGAQYALGDMYRFGKGVEPDTEQAIKWYTLAAEQGYADAQSDLELLDERAE